MKLSHNLRMAAAWKRAFGGAPVIEGDPYFDRVVSLLNFDTNLTDDKGIIWASAGNANVSGGALHLDGAGDYLETPFNTALQTNTGEFCVETIVTYHGFDPTWNGLIYLIDRPVNTTIAFRIDVGGDASRKFKLYLPGLDGTAPLPWLGNGGNGPTIDGTTTVLAETEYHVAVTRDGAGVFRLFVNGVLEGSNSDQAGALWSGTGVSRIGAIVLGEPYESNVSIKGFRMTKGVSRYKSNFIPPTTFPNTRDDVYDPWYDNVVSLLHFDGNLTDVKGKTWTAYGSMATSGTGKYGTNSLEGDGSAKWIDTPDTVDFTFGNADFTVEMWVKPHSVGQSNYSVMLYGSTSANTNPPSVGLMMAPGTYTFAYGVGNSSNGFERNAVTFGTGAQNTWSHLAICRSGATLRAFHNGVVGDTYNIGTTTLKDPLGMIVGGGNFTNCYFDGEIDDLRITKGIARYITNFTPSTIAFPNTRDIQVDPYFDNVVSLLHFDGGIHDIKGKTWTYQGNSTIAGNSKFGTHSLSCPDDGAYIETAQSNDFSFGTGDFTVECWVYKSHLGQCLVIDARNANTGQPWTFYINASEQIELYDGITQRTATHTVPQNQWVHIAMSRTAGTLKLFTNGVEGLSLSHPVSMDSTHMHLGGKFIGYIEGIDDLRITKGFGRYTTAFTPPTLAFPNQ